MVQIILQDIWDFPIAHNILIDISLWKTENFLKPTRIMTSCSFNPNTRCKKTSKHVLDLFNFFQRSDKILSKTKNEVSFFSRRILVENVPDSYNG